MTTPIEQHHHCRQAGQLRDKSRQRRSRNSQRRQRPDTEDQHRVKHHVQHHRQQHEPERRTRIARAAQRHHHEVVEIHERQRQEDDTQVAHRERRGIFRRMHRRQDVGRIDKAEHRRQHRQRHKERSAGPDHAPRLVQVARAHGLADHDRVGHADAEHHAQQEEQDDVGVGGCRQRRFAEKAPDPDRVDRCVQRLQDVAAEHRQREQQQGAADRARGQSGVWLHEAWRCAWHRRARRRGASGDG
ncbi:hypothetical protein D3C72_1377340 [compost metagenome]